MATVGIVVVTYRSAATVAACLESLRSAFSGEAEVVVVDNASDDESGKIAERAGASVTWLLKNYGYGHGNNAGLRALRSDPDYVVFANPDTVWPRESIDELLAILRTNPDVGLLSPVLIGSNGERQAFVERDLIGVPHQQIKHRHIIAAAHRAEELARGAVAVGGVVVAEAEFGHEQFAHHPEGRIFPGGRRKERRLALVASDASTSATAGCSRVARPAGRSRRCSRPGTIASSTDPTA